MPIHPNTLSSLAADYSSGMTSIRGRRVQRLLKREFAGAEYVFVVRSPSEMAAVLGLSKTGAAFCATDGRGKRASVARWLHGSAEALESHYDLLKDSLPLLASNPLPLHRLHRLAHLGTSAGLAPPEARDLVLLATQTLTSADVRDA